MSSQDGNLAAPARTGLARKVVWVVVLAAVVLFGLALVSDGAALLAALRSFEIVYLVPALLLASLNYGIRFVRWQIYLMALEFDVPVGASMGVFFSGLSMAITPRKLGELVKCIMLRDRVGSPPALTVPAVTAEGFTDLVAVLVLVSLGVFSNASVRPLFYAGVAVVVAIFVVLVLSPAAVNRLGVFLSRAVLKGRRMEWAAESPAAFRRLLSGWPLVAGLVLGVVAWFAECVAFWLVMQGFGGGVTLFQATFIYAVATLAGALSMLPGARGTISRVSRPPATR